MGLSCSPTPTFDLPLCTSLCLRDSVVVRTVQNDQTLWSKTPEIDGCSVSCRYRETIFCRPSAAWDRMTTFRQDLTVVRFVGGSFTARQRIESCDFFNRNSSIPRALAGPEPARGSDLWPRSGIADHWPLAGDGASRRPKGVSKDPPTRNIGVPRHSNRTASSPCHPE